MTFDDAVTLADELQMRVRRRTGLAGEALQCPREKSEMTPCVARDGRLAMILILDEAACVGCEARILPELIKERAR